MAKIYWICTDFVNNATFFSKINFVLKCWNNKVKVLSNFIDTSINCNAWKHYSSLQELCRKFCCVLVTQRLGALPLFPISYQNNSPNPCRTCEVLQAMIILVISTDRSLCLFICRFRGGMWKDHSAIPQEGLGGNGLPSGGGNGEW